MDSWPAPPFRRGRTQRMQIVGWILFLVACVGHTALCVATLNWLFGVALPHRLLGLLRRATSFLVLAGPAGVWSAFGFALFAGPGAPSAPAWRGLLAPYVVFCWLVGFGVFPVLTALRLLRRRPA